LGFERIVLPGKSDLCEIRILYAMDSPVVAFVDGDQIAARFLGLKVLRSYDDVDER
jgi:hypothetical protein